MFSRVILHEAFSFSPNSDSAATCIPDGDGVLRLDIWTKTDFADGSSMKTSAKGPDDMVLFAIVEEETEFFSM